MSVRISITEHSHFVAFPGVGGFCQPGQCSGFIFIGAIPAQMGLAQNDQRLDVALLRLEQRHLKSFFKKFLPFGRIPRDARTQSITHAAFKDADSRTHIRELLI